MRARKPRIKYGKSLMMSAMKFSSACNTRWGPCPLGLERGKYFGFDINEEECPFEKMRYSRCDDVDELVWAEYLLENPRLCEMKEIKKLVLQAKEKVYNETRP